MKRKATTAPPSRTQSRVMTKKKKTSNVQQKVTIARNMLSNADIKSHTVTLSGTGITLASPVYQQLTDPSVIGQNAGQLNGYIGSRIKPVGLTVRFKLSAGDATQFVRVGIFQSEGQFSTAPGTYFLSTTDPASAINPYPPTPFITLHDSCHSQVIGGDTQVKFWKVYIPGSRLLPVTFNTSNVVTSGMIQCVVLSDSAAAPNPAIAITSILKYLDV